MSWLQQQFEKYNVSLEEIIEDGCYGNTLCILFSTVVPTFYVLAGVFICCGNLLTIVAVCRTEELRTNQNFYIMSLAVADLCAGITLFAASTMHMVHLMPNTMYSKPLCVAGHALEFTNVCASSISIVFIALDRHLYIIYPFKYETLVTTKRCIVVIIVTWTVSLLNGAFIFSFNRHNGNMPCFFVGIIDPTYQLITSTVLFFIVLIVVLILYGRIAVFAHQHQTRIMAQGTSDSWSMWRSKIRNLRLVLTVCGLYVACWLPYHVAYCKYMIHTISEDDEVAMSFLFLLGCLNSGVNFIIYPCMNKEFRNAFAAILCFWKKKKR